MVDSNMKRVLIMVISSQQPPYDKMADTSQETWDSIEVDGVDAIFYFGSPVRPFTDKRIYLGYKEGYHVMSHKTVDAFWWALENKEFDYIARINSSTYVNKKSLLKYAQTLPEENVFNGLIVEGDAYHWLWGPFFILSKDVVQKYVDNAHLIDHSVMDDMAISKLMHQLGVNPSCGIGCSIDRSGDKWRAICYGTESFEFSQFSDIIKAKDHWAFRVKQDLDRSQDEYIMRELFKNLNS